MELTVLALIVLLSTTYVFAEPSRCYFCNTEVHGQGCNDPIDESAIQVQSCSDSQIVEPSFLSEVTGFIEDHGFVSSTDAADNLTTTVCITLNYIFDSRNVTARGCETAARHTGFIEMDVCAFYQAGIPSNRISNFSCNLCHNNLCNYISAGETLVGSVKVALAVIMAKVLFL